VNIQLSSLGASIYFLIQLLFINSVQALINEKETKVYAVYFVLPMAYAFELKASDRVTLLSLWAAGPSLRCHK
jgi:hypothetical protein